jgi:hypothetical protein
LAPGRSPAIYTVYDIRPLRARADSLTHSVIFGPAELENRYIRRFLERAYDAGETVAAARTRPAAAMALRRAIGAPELGTPDSGPLRAELAAFRQVQQGGRTIFSVLVLTPRDEIPAALKAGNQAADQFIRTYLVGEPDSRHRPHSSPFESHATVAGSSVVGFLGADGAGNAASSKLKN